MANSLIARQPIRPITGVGPVALSGAYIAQNGGFTPCSLMHYRGVDPLYILSSFRYSSPWPGQFAWPQLMSLVSIGRRHKTSSPDSIYRVDIKSPFPPVRIGRVWGGGGGPFFIYVSVSLMIPVGKSVPRLLVETSPF